MLKQYFNLLLMFFTNILLTKDILDSVLHVRKFGQYFAILRRNKFKVPFLLVLNVHIRPPS